MRLHTVVISYQRLPLLQETIASYLATVTVPFTLQVVDNAGGEDVNEWLAAQPFPTVWLDRNYYPGYAANRGFELAPADATHLHRSDSDMEYLPGWCDEAERAFERLGPCQLGLRTDEEEQYADGNVGGTMMISRQLWDEGLRYREEPWTRLGSMTEDFWLSQAVLERGYRWARVERPCVVHKGTGDMRDPYYRQSFQARGLSTRRRR